MQSDASLESLQNKTIKNFEVIVFDDGSTDNSPEYLRVSTDSRFKITRQENAGLADILDGKPIKGMALFFGQLISNPGIVWERIKSRL